MVSKGLKLENHNEVGGLFFEEPTTFGPWEQQLGDIGGYNLGLPSLLEFEPFWLANQMSMTSQVKLNDFEEISNDLGMWDFDQQSFHNDINHIIDYQNHDIVSTRMYECNSNPLMALTYQREFSSSNKNMEVKRGRYKSSALQLEQIQKYFDVPITRAAKELNVGLTVLKKRCRELNITRWPHRKIKSLKSLIHNVKELGLTNEIGMLEEHKRMVEKIPEIELTERTKKLRQACFKANYKKRRALQQQVTPS
ncbi:hypothetical protein CDL12_05897 [Handroanthus impetiginosus]|uniref:RWP-RK domain-containing protein n=1 Tax=Handroanthus impetiginosus TaxID=429701 RepID=A0A2G9HV85_9LAMI|nr:hypothetical protein CDL12_05897 [Handroanthus impetiginosus]